MTTELATRPADNLPAAFDEAAVLRVLKMDARDPNAQALVLVCRRYNLDPLLRHAVLISGSLYVTRDGLMHVAHASGKFDGLEVETVSETDTHFVAVATVYRKDMGRPFRFQGRYPRKGRLAGDYGPEMAEKVAVCRALRHAFDVSLCSQEELWDQEPALPLPERTGRAVASKASVEEANKPGKQVFAEAGESLGFDVRAADGRYSTRKLVDLLSGALGRNMPSSPQDSEWIEGLPGLAALAEQRQREALAAAPSEASSDDAPVAPTPTADPKPSPTAQDNGADFDPFENPNR